MGCSSPSAGSTFVHASLLRSHSWSPVVNSMAETKSVVGVFARNLFAVHARVWRFLSNRNRKSYARMRDYRRAACDSPPIRSTLEDHTQRNTYGVASQTIPLMRPALHQHGMTHEVDHEAEKALDAEAAEHNSEKQRDEMNR